MRKQMKSSEYLSRKLENFIPKTEWSQQFWESFISQPNRSKRIFQDTGLSKLLATSLPLGGKLLSSYHHLQCCVIFDPNDFLSPFVLSDAFILRETECELQWKTGKYGKPGHMNFSNPFTSILVKAMVVESERFHIGNVLKTYCNKLRKNRVSA